MSAIDRALEQWRAQGIVLNPGATDAQLQRLQAFLGADLPADVRHYFASANGMAERQWTEEVTHFWSIEEIVNEPETDTGSDAQGEFRDVVCADTLILAWCVWLRVYARQVTIYLDAQRLECRRSKISSDSISTIRMPWAYSRS